MPTPTVPAEPQLPGLARAAARRAKSKPARVAEALADENPIARVLVDLPLAHLDREFDYSVPASMADKARPGARVKVRFAGREVAGYVVGRTATSPHGGKLSPLRRVVSPEPVLAPEIVVLAGEVARRYAGTRSDVLRLAIPPRHARVEAEQSPIMQSGRDRFAEAHGAWRHTEQGAAFIGHLADLGNPRAVWSAAPGDDWPSMLAHAASATYAAGRGALMCVPDGRDVDRVDAALTAVLGAGHHVALRADAGPAVRYREFLAISRGARRVVVGTRSAAFAPVRDLGLVAIWDDGDDSYAEPRAPYPHAREVLFIRAKQQNTAALLGGFARSVEADALVRSGWAREIAVSRETLRQRVTVAVSSAETDPGRDPHGRGARVPRVVFDAMRRGLQDGPVLVQTPRSGYAPALACDRCRTPARCQTCHGPLALKNAASAPGCTWCGREAVGWSCVECGHRGLRAPVVGGRRTSEELGKAFPGVLVRTSDGDQVLSAVEGEPALVVATPGAEPVAAGGYRVVVLLDTWLPLSRADLRTDEEALRRWLNAAGLVQPGGTIMVVGDSSHPAIQALVRWDPAGFAQRESEQRAAAHLPPAAWLATITGEPGPVDDAMTLLAPPQSAELLGPAPLGTADEVRVVVRVPSRDAAALSDALGELQRVRSVRKLDPVRIQVNPMSL